MCPNTQLTLVSVSLHRFILGGGTGLNWPEHKPSWAKSFSGSGSCIGTQRDGGKWSVKCHAMWTAPSDGALTSPSGLDSVLRQLIILSLSGVPPDLHLQPNWHSSSHLGRSASLPAQVQLSVSRVHVLYLVISTKNNLSKWKLKADLGTSSGVWVLL